jgi:protein-S-isoprenylcysteine O-methyltransferase Ste14
VTPALYRRVRHPFYLGWLILFWATPQMSGGHVLLAAVRTAYILAAILLEEWSLRQNPGRFRWLQRLLREP